MFHDELAQWRRIPGLDSHPIWCSAFEWIERMADSAAEGVHPLGQAGYFARVMCYALKDRASARYELHRQTIDIQYTITGAEAIELAVQKELEPLHDYSPEKDVEHYVTPTKGSACIDNLKGRFTVLFPGEAHMPQLVVPGFSEVRKVVVKIPMALLR